MDLGKISIDEIGTFSLLKTPASFGLNKAEITPPATQIQFESKQNTGTSFSKALMNAGIPSDIALGLENTLKQDYIASINNAQPLSLAPIGVLNEDRFLASSPEIFNRFDGLRAMSISPLPPDVSRSYVHTKELAHEPIATTMIVEKPATPWLKYLAPLLLALTTFTIIGVWYQSSTWLASSDVIEAQYAPKPSVIHSSESQKSQILDTIDKMYDEKFSSPSAQKEAAPIKSTPTAPKAKKTTAVKSQKVVKSTPTPIASASTETGECVFILGAFKESSNATRMVDKINNKGYRTYISEVNGLQRVGVIVECTGKNVDSFKQEIRRKLKSDSWHLQD